MAPGLLWRVVALPAIGVTVGRVLGRGNIIRDRLSFTLRSGALTEMQMLIYWVPDGAEDSTFHGVVRRC